MRPEAGGHVDEQQQRRFPARLHRRRWRSETKDSSKAILNLPAGAQVRFAGLYWGGRPELEPAGSQPNLTKAEFGEVKLAPPGGGYQPVTASVVDEVVFGINTNATWQGFADVTGIVQAAGGGEYMVGGVRVEGARSTSNGSWGGWSLVVAYSHPAEPWRNLVVYDGLKGVNSGGSSVDIPLSGFTTPPAPANVDTTFGVVAYEGDLSTGNDRVGVVQEASEVFLADALTSANNFFNSAITREGVDVGDRTPAYTNQLGYDAKLINVQNALKNSTTSATVRVSTSGDGVAPGVISATTELFVPDVTLTKSVENLTDPGAPIASPGDVLEYTITAENEIATPAAPVDSAGSFVLSDAIPAGTTYVPGSLALTAGPNAPATPSDAVGDDVGEFDGGAEEVVFRLGTGADGTSGGTLAPGATTTAAFRVEIDNDFSGGPIDNEALADYRAVTLDRPLQETADVSLLSEPLSDLSIVKSASPAQVGPAPLRWTRFGLASSRFL